MDRLTVGTLFTNKRGQMFTVYSIENYKYKGDQKQKVTYYPIGDSGLITKTKAFTCKSSDIGTKFKKLNWIQKKKINDLLNKYLKFNKLHGKIKVS